MTSKKDMLAFEAAMKANGFNPPQRSQGNWRNPRITDYVSCRDQDRFDGWMLAQHTPAHTAQREPLTTAEIEQLLARWDYHLHGDRARYLVREAEKAHGITKGGK